jgi:hypothetical protein
MPEYFDKSAILKYSFLIMPPYYQVPKPDSNPKKIEFLEEIHPKFRSFLDVQNNEETGRI